MEYYPQILSIVSHPVFFFPIPREKKKTNKSYSEEVGRRSYVITCKKKNDPPLLKQLSTERKSSASRRCPDAVVGRDPEPGVTDCQQGGPVLLDSPSCTWC